MVIVKCHRFSPWYPPILIRTCLCLSLCLSPPYTLSEVLSDFNVTLSLIGGFCTRGGGGPTEVWVDYTWSSHLTSLVRGSYTNVNKYIFKLFKRWRHYIQYVIFRIGLFFKISYSIVFIFIYKVKKGVEGITWWNKEEEVTLVGSRKGLR